MSQKVVAKYLIYAHIQNIYHYKNEGVNILLVSGLVYSDCVI